ncbi:hypothetical protein PENTCL1PPCAC_21250, partial [Pristionchus entomophagus]
RFNEISKLTSTEVYSHPTEIGGLNWRIMLFKTDDHLSFFVEAQNNNTENWSCSAIVERQLISQKCEDIVHSKSSKKANVYTKGIYDNWGRSKFISFKDLFDE